jgi:hypothetical protein
MAANRESTADLIWPRDRPNETHTRTQTTCSPDIGPPEAADGSLLVSRSANGSSSYFPAARTSSPAVAFLNYESIE